MTRDLKASRLPSWISVLVRPRETIERIAGNVSTGQIICLAGLSGFAGIASYLIQLGVIAELKDWRVLLGALLVGALLGVIQLYVVAFLIAWVARKWGSSASMSDVRAALAWGGMPIILGGALIVIIVLSSSATRSAGAGSLSEILEMVLGVCGLWSIIITLFMLSRVLKLGAWRTIPLYAGCALLFPFLAAVAIRVFLFQPFATPSTSMSPTLLSGDYLFANKFSTRFLAAEPRQGDVIAFTSPKDKSTVYLKRVVGLAGDRVQMKDGQLIINGNAVKRERLADYDGNKVCGESAAATKHWRETLPNGVSHETLDCAEHGPYDSTAELVVPAGHVFVMGDNRDNSTDSRVPTFGTVPVANVFGHVGMIFLSRERGANGGESLRLERIGTFVR